MSVPQWHTYEVANLERMEGRQTNMFFNAASFGSILRHWKDECRRNRWFIISERFKSVLWISIGHCLRLCFMSFQVVLMTNAWLWFWMWATCCFSRLSLSCSHCIICPSIHLSFFLLSYAQFLPFFIWNLSMFVSHFLSLIEIYQLFGRWHTGINLKALISDSKDLLLFTFIFLSVDFSAEKHLEKRICCILDASPQHEMLAC